MARLMLTLQDASRQPLADRFELHIKGARDLATYLRQADLDGTQIHPINLPQTQPFIIQVYPRYHRPVGGPTPIMNADAEMTLNTPIHPDFATPAFPAWSKLPATLKTVLEASRLEGEAASHKGKTLYEALGDEDKAGLLNVFTKMMNTGLPGAVTTWDFVTGVYRIRPDRIFVDVDITFRDAVKAAEQANLFKEAPDNQHTPPPDFENAGSFKSHDRAGNLQLTFFSSIDALAFKVDADIDDANGVGHVFQVLGHWLTGGETHPYDIHEILTFDQRMSLPYDLAAP